MVWTAFYDVQEAMDEAADDPTVVRVFEPFDAVDKEDAKSKVLATLK